MHRLVARFAVALTLVLSPALAQAQDDGQLDEAARLTFESAREAFVAGDYETALDRFRQAYQLSPRPGLLYNIAQTLDRLRRDEETVEALREYIEAVPDAPNRPEVEARIRVLERSLAERESEAQVTAPPPASDPDPDPPPATPVTEPAGGDGIHPAVFLSVGGLALVGAVLTIWTGLETIALNDAYLLDRNPETVAASYDEALTYQTLTNVLIATSSALGVAAVVLAIFTDWDAFGGGAEDTASLRPIVTAGPSGAMAGVGGSF